MQTVNNNKPEQINSALFSISDDITKQNIQTKNAIKSSEAGLQKQIDKLTDSLQNNGGLITGGTYDINISGNASTATNATNATNADKATQDSAGNTIATTYAKKTEVPTKTSQLTNDSSFVTSGQLATVATSGSYNDLSNKPTIPTKTSQLTNDSSFVTSGQLATVATSGKYSDLSGTPTIPTNISQLTNDSNFVTSGQLAKVATSGSYNDLSNKPTIPTKTSQLTNDSSFVTSGQLATVATSGSYNDLSNKPTIPTKTSQLTNDSGYITSSGSITGNAATATTAGTANVANALAHRGNITNTDTFQNVMNNDGKWIITDLVPGWIGSLYSFHVGGSQSGLMFRIRGDSCDIRNIEVNYSIDSNRFAGPWNPLIGRIPTSKPSTVSPGDIWIE